MFDASLSVEANTARHAPVPQRVGLLVTGHVRSFIGFAYHGVKLLNLFLVPFFGSLYDYTLLFPLLPFIFATFMESQFLSLAVIFHTIALQVESQNTKVPRSIADLMRLASLPNNPALLPGRSGERPRQNAEIHAGTSALLGDVLWPCVGTIVR